MNPLHGFLLRIFVSDAVHRPLPLRIRMSILFGPARHSRPLMGIRTMCHSPASVPERNSAGSPAPMLRMFICPIDRSLSDTIADTPDVYAASEMVSAASTMLELSTLNRIDHTPGCTCAKHQSLVSLCPMS